MTIIGHKDLWANHRRSCVAGGQRKAHSCTGSGGPSPVHLSIRTPQSVR